VVWYSHLFQNFPQFIVIHTVRGFGIVNKAEIEVFLEVSCFFNDPADVGNLISGSSAFSKISLNNKAKLPHIQTQLLSSLSEIQCTFFKVGLFTYSWLRSVFLVAHGLYSGCGCRGRLSSCGTRDCLAVVAASPVAEHRL